MFVINMVKGHNLQQRYCPVLFCNFKWFNFKTALAQCPVVQKEVDEILAKGVIESSTGDDVMYSNVWYASVWEVYVCYLILNDSLATCTYYI